MDIVEQSTCGKGLAENSVLPATLSNLIAAMAENLAVHMKVLDPTDSNSQAEQNAYENLIKKLRETAVELQWTANEMAGYRDLPVGKHGHAAMTQPVIRETFEKFVKHKQELLSCLEQTAERDSQLLQRMRTSFQESKENHGEQTYSESNNDD
jgi:methylthioribose-1-phosphate isomerase